MYIVVKATLYIIQDDNQGAAGLHQLCMGQVTGTEIAVYAVRSVFNQDDSDAILLVDAMHQCF